MLFLHAGQRDRDGGPEGGMIGGQWPRRPFHLEWRDPCSCMNCREVVHSLKYRLRSPSSLCLASRVDLHLLQRISTVPYWTSARSDPSPARWHNGFDMSGHDTAWERGSARCLN